ncbi:hypothetical protein HQN90_29990 [Paenibacillus alba]|nr:hypothetical protein [Paenibacillus alba]
MDIARVILDYMDAIFWILLSVVLYFGELSGELDANTITYSKFILFGLIIQTKVIKAYAGQKLLLMDDSKPKN